MPDKVLVLFDTLRPTSLDQDCTEDLKSENWATEAHAMNALRSLGHPHAVRGLYDDLDLVRQKIVSFQPDVIFNLVECFKGNSSFDQHKGISKQILSFHRIRVP